LAYSLEFKRITVGTIELVPITIKPLTIVSDANNTGSTGSKTSTKTNIINNPTNPSLTGKTKKDKGIGYVEKAYFLFTNVLGFDTPTGWK